jgi:hypothetical protein
VFISAPKTSAVLLVAGTGGLETEAVTAGADEVLHKPIAINTLVAAVDKHPGEMGQQAKTLDASHLPSYINTSNYAAALPRFRRARATPPTTTAPSPPSNREIAFNGDCADSGSSVVWPVNPDVVRSAESMSAANHFLRADFACTPVALPSASRVPGSTLPFGPNSIITLQVIPL